MQSADMVPKIGGAFQGNKPTAGSFLSNDDQNFNIRSAYCKEPHYSASCKKITYPESRKAILRKTNRCFNCLRVDHRLSNCQSTKNCRYWKQKHHQSICNSPNYPKQNANEENSDNKSTSEVHDTTTTSTLKKKATVLLQTATTTATNSHGSRSAKVRILFDSGSRRVSNSLARLNLKSVKSETLNLNTFGNSKFRKQYCVIVIWQNCSDKTKIMAK
jgi:hypothetical protein